MSRKKGSVCAVVVTYNRKNLLIDCIESLLRQTYSLDAIYIIDNASSDGTPQALKKRQYIRDILIPADEPMEDTKRLSCRTDSEENNPIIIHYVRMNRNTGGAGGFHEGVKRAFEQYDWIWLMDDDTAPKEDALEKLAVYFERTDVVALAGAVFFPKGGIFYVTRGTIDLKKTYPTIQKPLPAETYERKEIAIDMASFVGTLVNSDAVRKIGLPRKEFFIFHDDIEYCLRLRKIGKILLVTDSVVYHREPSSERIEKSFLGKRAFRVPYDKFWLIYFQKRNLVWLGKEHAENRIGFYYQTVNSLLRLVSGVLRFDDHKMKRILCLVLAYLDGLRGNFDNEKPKKILFS